MTVSSPIREKTGSTPRMHTDRGWSQHYKYLSEEDNSAGAKTYFT